MCVCVCVCVCVYARRTMYVIVSNYKMSFLEDTMCIHDVTYNGTLDVYVYQNNFKKWTAHQY